MFFLINTKKDAGDSWYDVLYSVVVVVVLFTDMSHPLIVYIPLQNLNNFVPFQGVQAVPKSKSGNSCPAQAQIMTDANGSPVLVVRADADDYSTPSSYRNRTLIRCAEAYNSGLPLGAVRTELYGKHSKKKPAVSTIFMEAVAPGDSKYGQRFVYRKIATDADYADEDQQSDDDNNDYDEE